MLYVPAHIKRRGGYPLVVLFHGGASNAEAIAKGSAMHKLAEEKGFAVAYPVGTQGGAGLTWKPSGRNASRKIGDIRFVRRLLLRLQRQYDIDPSRIFFAGFSIGGTLVYELGTLMADRVAAIGVVGGSMLDAIARPTRPVPLIHIHGLADQRVPFEGGQGRSTAEANEWPPVQAGIDFWRAANGCEAPPIRDDSIPGVTGLLYRGLADIELWTIEDGTHSWPVRKATTPAAGTPSEPSFSASEAIWRFFSTRPRRKTFLATGEQVESVRPVRLR
ncbi:protein of unknown function [Beijerinckiaceae bacterium RH CH11]|nr:protein of unknown function [Beijerinckiaceae bacterium RH CH11]VVB44362.1 protein of unknown function [Beijerinckiaceae bacterium RH AL8]